MLKLEILAGKVSVDKEEKLKSSMLIAETRF